MLQDCVCAPTSACLHMQHVGLRGRFEFLSINKKQTVKMGFQDQCPWREQYTQSLETGKRLAWLKERRAVFIEHSGKGGKGKEYRQACLNFCLQLKLLILFNSQVNSKVIYYDYHRNIQLIISGKILTIFCEYNSQNSKSFHNYSIFEMQAKFYESKVKTYTYWNSVQMCRGRRQTI